MSKTPRLLKQYLRDESGKIVVVDIRFNPKGEPGWGYYSPPKTPSSAPQPTKK